MAAHKTNDKPGDQAATEVPLNSVYTNNLPAILDHFGISLVVSTYQAGKLIACATMATDYQHPLPQLQQADGHGGGRPAADCGRPRTRSGTTATCRPRPSWSRWASHDACYLPREVPRHRRHRHPRVGLGQATSLWMVNTRFSACAPSSPTTASCRAGGRLSYRASARRPLPSQRPGVVEGQPKYVTALGETDTPGGWRANKRRAAA